ncbi:MAG: BTAD domain-containing putative transcriptional regulator [Actinomycetota bacterium]
MVDRPVAAQLRCSVLGPLRVQVDGDLARLRPGHPERLLALLLAAQGDFVSVDRLVERLWDGRPPSAAVATLHSHVRAVRGALGAAGTLIANQRGRGYRVRLAPADPDGATLDLLDFRSHVGAARQLVQSDEIVAARAELQAALDCWHGPVALPELADDLDARSLVVELASLREWAEQQAVDLAMRTGDPSAVIPELEAALAREPTDQRTAARLMRAYASSGRPERASAVYGELVRLLRDRSGDVPLPELAELDGQILRHDPEVVALRPVESVEAAPAAASEPARPVGLGAELTSFVGREAELAEVAAALDRAPIVTLVGAGGCGKTRLARELARRSSAGSAVRLVQLADCPEGDAAAVVERIGRVWGLEVDALDQLLGSVAAASSGPELMVLDNCEHVLDHAALAVVSLVERVPDLRVLVTSREALHLPGERIVPLKPLPIATDTAGDDAGPSDGARLFTTRAVDAGWNVDPATVLGSPVQRRLVEQICRRLDGLPLAIELVAPLASLYTLDELEQRLAEQPEVARPVRSPHLRQRTLGEVIDWSVSRLTEHEHAALLTASAFAGPFTREAFASVADATFPSNRTADWSRLPDALVSRSLLSPVADDDTTRFRLLETIRSHTRRLAREGAVADSLAAAHAQHFADHAASVGDPARAGDVGDVIRSAELSDLRAALLWAIDVGRDDLAIRLLDGVNIRMYRLSLPPAVVAWLERLGAGDGPHAAVALDLRATQALFSGDYERLDRLADRTLAALRDSGDRRRSARALVIAAFSYVLADRNDEAAELIATARERSAELDDDWLSAWVDAVDGLLARRAGRLDHAEEASRRALERFVGLGDRLGTLLPTLNLGRIECARGDVDAGLALLDRGTALAEVLGDRLGTTLGHAYSARVLLAAGRVDDALDRLVGGLRSGRSAPNRVLLAALLDYVAAALAALGDDETAARLVGRAETLRPMAVRDPLGLCASAQERMGAAAFDLAARTGGALHLDEAIDLAIERLALARARTGAPPRT